MIKKKKGKFGCWFIGKKGKKQYIELSDESIKEINNLKEIVFKINKKTNRGDK